MREHDYTEQALLTGFLACGLNIPVQYENSPFEKPSASPWAAVWYFPSVSEGVTAGPNGYDELRGFFQVDINIPLNTGTAPSKELVNKVMQGFPSGYALMYNGGWVKPTSVSRSPGREIDGWWRVSVTVYWYSRLQRLGA